MSNCCKCAKWWPHNWLCLKGLSILFVVLFYLALVYAVFQAYIIFAKSPLFGRDMWTAAAFYAIQDLAAAVGFLTVAKVLGALRKIKKAVAPCCCTVEDAPAMEEASIEEVVEKESK